MTPMESVGSSSSQPDNQPQLRYKMTQPVADRIIRALRHRLRLLHRSESNFFILGATGNVYTVTLSTTPICTCPDRTTPCKHILFTLIRVLGVSLDDTCLQRKTLRPGQLEGLLGTPSLHDAMAGATVRERFHQLFYQARQETFRASVEIEDGTVCPVCLDELGTGETEKVVACQRCRNPIHEQCLTTWKRVSRRRSATCVICRARWRNSQAADQDAYLNLSAYISEEDTATSSRLFNE